MMVCLCILEHETIGKSFYNEGQLEHNMLGSFYNFCVTCIICIVNSNEVVDILLQKVWCPMC